MRTQSVTVSLDSLRDKLFSPRLSSALSIYYDGIQDFDLLFPKKENQLIEKYKITKNANIKDIIVNSYQKQLLSLCNYYANNQSLLEEYISDANLILLSCIDSYVITNSYSFRTYVSYQIRKYFDSMLINKNNNNKTNRINKNCIEINDVAVQNALSIIQGLLSEDEYSVALRMFGFLSDNHPLSNEHIANQLGKDEIEIENIKKMVLTKISSEEVKKQFISNK